MPEDKKNKPMKTTIKKIAICAAILGLAAGSYAQDRQTLDLLVSKGLITRAEADSIRKGDTKVTPKEKGVKSLKVSGRIQGQYEYIDNDEDGADLSAKSSFLMRRIFLGAEADLGAGWKGELVADFANSKGGYLEKVYISKKLDFGFLNGEANFGYRKVDFAVEETTSSSKLLSVERSLATRYFAEGNDGRKLGLAGRHTGIYWSGKVNTVDGLTYGLSVTGSYNNNPTSLPANAGNDLLYCANAAYAAKLDSVKIAVGANLAYTNGMNVDAFKPNRQGGVFGINPYVKASVDNLDLWGEFLLANVEDGIKSGSSTKDATPMGANLGAEYKFDAGDLGKFAPTVRLSWLDTDGRGIKASDGVRDANAQTVYARGKSVYAGINWYIKGNDIKYQLGYEFAKLDGSPYGASTSGSANANAVRTQIQVLF